MEFLKLKYKLFLFKKKTGLHLLYNQIMHKATKDLDAKYIIYSHTLQNM